MAVEGLFKIRANPIQRHRPMPPLCKGRGTARGGGGVVQKLNSPCEFNSAVLKKQFSYRMKRDNLALHRCAKFS